MTMLRKMFGNTKTYDTLTAEDCINMIDEFYSECVLKRCEELLFAYFDKLWDEFDPVAGIFGWWIKGLLEPEDVEEECIPVLQAACKEIEKFRSFKRTAA